MNTEIFIFYNRNSLKLQPKLKKYKSDFTIKRIGYFQFYTGIIIGIGYSIILNFLFQLLTKTNSIIIAMGKGYWNNSINSRLGFYYSFFFGLLSVSLAFCFTTFLWMSKLISGKRKEVRYLRFAQTNSFFIFGVIMLVLTRFFTIYCGFNYDRFYIDLKEYFGFIAFFLPLFIFLYCWSLISKIYISKNILLISLFIFISLGILLSNIKV